MPVRVCNVDDLIKPKRGRKAAIDSLQEFIDLKIKLSDGLKFKEAVEVTLPDKPKNLRTTFKTKVMEYLRNKNITDWEVRSYVSGGRNIVTVVNETPMVYSKAA